MSSFQAPLEAKKMLVQAKSLVVAWRKIWHATTFTGVPWEPVTDLVRYTTGLWLLTVLILANVYRSNLKAMLTIPRIDIPFDSVEELADSDISTAINKDTKIYNQIMVKSNGSLR